MVTPGTLSSNPDDLNRYLAFSLGNEEYAIPLLSVKEVIALPEITPIPYTPPHFLGVMNLRGQVISVLDLRLKFRMKKVDKTPDTTVIICDLSPHCLGMVVDSVNNVLAFKKEEIRPRPEFEMSADNECIMGVARKDNSLIVLLDIFKTVAS